MNSDSSSCESQEAHFTLVYRHFLPKDKTLGHQRVNPYGGKILKTFIGNLMDMAGSLAFAAEVKVKAVVELQSLSAINEALARLEQGKVASHVVIDLKLGG